MTAAMCMVFTDLGDPVRASLFWLFCSFRTRIPSIHRPIGNQDCRKTRSHRGWGVYYSPPCITARRGGCVIQKI